MPLNRNGRPDTAPLAALAFLTVLTGAATPREAIGMLALSWLSSIRPSPEAIDRLRRKRARK